MPGPQNSICLTRPPSARVRQRIAPHYPDPAYFHCETRATPTPDDEIRLRKIPNLKAFLLRFRRVSSTNGETMGTAASPFLNPIAAELEGVGPKRTAEALSRPARQRRQIQGMSAVGYVIDAGVLLIYAHAGTIPATIGPAYAACGLVFVACNLVLSETGFNERFKDHYFVVPQSIVSMAIMLAFTYIAPEVGGMFLCTLFVVFSFSSLRSTPRQTAVVWTAMALGMSVLFLLTDKPIAMPNGSYLERVATMLVFILTIGRS